ncbi:hypothetical protein PQO01_13865 [Lentisphaera marina]|uniref:hypothetical protein n=1 Tax=Lentisphaera marina TaxID=1111041 RepID=UPI00236582C6|nr:hypothetical protein [Lentisphaera marina]MDD7986033.1 hypothetical protein [Lentisphaera marina]
MSQALDQLNVELESLSKKLRQQVLIKAVFEGAAYFLFGLVAFFILDRFGDFPMAFRIIVLLSGIGCLLYYLKTKYWLNYTSPYSREEVSLLVEKKFPQFRSRLISTLQFSKNKPGKMVSADLVDGMMDQTFDMYGDYNFSEVIDTEALKKVLKVFVISLAGIILMSIIAPQSFPIYLQRFYSQLAYPTSTQFEEINLPEYAIAGEETSMSIKMTGELPASGYITVYSSESKAEYDVDQSEEKGVYQFAIPAQMENLSMRFKIGDYSSQAYDLPIKKRPAIAELKVEVIPPAYTGIKAYTEESGNLQVPFGSKLNFSLKTSKELNEFKLIPKIDEVVLPKVQGAGSQWNFSLNAETKMKYTFQLLDQDSLESKGIPEFSLRVKVDKAPRVRLIEPSALRELSPISRMPLEAEFEDDYQIASVKVLYTVIDSEYDQDLDFDEFKVWKSYADINDKTFSLKELWDNRSIEVEAGRNLKVRIQVTDNAPEPQTSFSQDILIPIISQEELKGRLADEFLNSVEPVEDILLKLNDVNRKMDRLGDK